MTTKRWKTKMGEQTREERIKELNEKLEIGVAEFSYTPDEFKAYLEMKAIMPSYSFRNLILAKAQLPQARFLASFKHWNTLGRKVKKGSKSLKILAPRFKKDDEDENRLTGFIPVPVFDVSQTEGEPLPIERIKIEVDGDCMEARHIIGWAEAIAEKDNCPIMYGNSDDAYGYYVPSEHRIVVSDKVPMNHQCKTLVHELVHSKVHRYDRNSSRTEKEVVAEGTAFVVCSYFNLDTSDYSFRYVKGWANGEQETLLKYGSQICDTAKKIIEEFEEIEEKEKAEKMESVPA